MTTVKPYNACSCGCMPSFAACSASKGSQAAARAKHDAEMEHLRCLSFGLAWVCGFVAVFLFYGLDMKRFEVCGTSQSLLTVLERIRVLSTCLSTMWWNLLETVRLPKSQGLVHILVAILVDVVGF